MDAATVFSILIACPSCGAKNRVPAPHLADTGRCGSCKSTLPPLAEPLEVDASAFHEIVSSAKVPVLADFWAPWCGPCRIAAPEVHKLANAMRGRALVIKVNTEDHPELANHCGIQSIPNFLVFRGGRAVFRRAGVASNGEMQHWIAQAARTPL